MLHMQNLHGGLANGARGRTRSDARIVAPSPETQPGGEQAIGTWLCEEGPYQKYIAALSGSNPSLKKADPNNKDHPLTDNNALVVLLELPSTENSGFSKTEFRAPQDLAEHFQDVRTAYGVDANHGRRRIYVMEGLAKKYIAALGGHFMMDPAFFQRQERTCVWSNDFTPVSDALPHPSLLDPEKSFHLQYCELRQFSKAIENKPYFCNRTMRHVGMTPPRHKEDSTIGILRRKVSWWSRKTSNGGWDVVILCDPQLAELNTEPREFNKFSRRYTNLKQSDPLLNTPFQEGYVDFVPSASHFMAAERPKHPHSSMLRDLIHYYTNHSDLLTADDWTEPSKSSVFVKKIVAAHYLQLVDYIKAMLPSLELRLESAWVEEQEQWKSLQTISRRCGNYRDDVEDTFLSLGYPIEELNSERRVDWKDCRKDFEYIYRRLKILKERADTLMQSMTGLASIAGNRQNLEEAKRAKRLNLLALLFVPLAYTSSLFSMQDDYAPNKGSFWVYWVSALSVVVLTYLTTLVLDQALDDAAQWELPFRRLRGQKHNLNAEPAPQKRRGTGFYNFK
ncbi:hypothetical protein BU23DRAFT_231802 [Bimuria novae-zelandiae CBS 107.79]|uniref:Cora-domain-containing protein n=1 Tax=Bimuria novae-zelandiae CBS 107.79 TaxID=1447943 RepID=A0A6A5UYL0_9PLEO|nr:hypothetical protein BU23DRAFT_231802 [Bimuria novae-zelandiae CBS 107.79]